MLWATSTRSCKMPAPLLAQGTIISWLPPGTVQSPVLDAHMHMIQCSSTLTRERPHSFPWHLLSVSAHSILGTPPPTPSPGVFPHMMPPLAQAFFS